MNLPNKITLGRIIISIIILIIMIFPFYNIGYTFPKYLVMGRVVVNLKYIICGILFIIASVCVLPVVIPVVIITRDIIVDSIKMIAGSKGKVVAASIWGKIKNVCMMFGLSLLFFNNLPFELLNFSLGYYLVIIACILSIYSGVQYFMANKEFITTKM